jgi:hypothetical protein
MLPSTKGSDNTPNVTLEDAIVPIVSITPNIQQIANIAKAIGKVSADNLNLDQSASIILYSME